MRIMLTGVAIAALAATSAPAQHGGGQGGGKGGPAHGNAQASPQGGGKGGGNGGPERAGAASGQSPKPDRGTQREAARAPGNSGHSTGKHEAGGFLQAPRTERPQQQGNQPRGPGRDKDAIRASRSENPRSDAVPAATAQRGVSNRSDFAAEPYRWSQAPRFNALDGCPPGLAKKNNGCTPPGLDRRDPWLNVYERPDWWGYRDWGGGRAGYYDGYLVRYSGSGIASYIPLLGGALSIGGLWPENYDTVALPDYYQDYYSLGPSYRYADDVLYRVDPETSTIDSIAALLTGDDIAVGQRLPDDYGVYNVPYGFRDRYADTDDALYRYSDGYVYEVDPTTRLVQAAIQLLL